MAVPVGRWGLTYHQVAELARRLGATDAALLDGGGSTTVVIRRGGGIARVDATGRIPQRAVPNGLVLVPVR
jgi:exopolysaccharide biosynthesis protein